MLLEMKSKLEKAKSLVGKGYYIIPLSEYNNIKEENKQLKKEVETLKATVLDLTEKIKVLQQAIFGKKSESQEIPSGDDKKSPETLETVSGYKRVKKKEKKAIN